MKRLLQDAIRERPLLGDGAMGTQLMIAGLEQGNCGEAWNLTHPERVLAIQRRYVEAGSDCLITNTFGGSRIMLNRHSEANHAVEVNRAGVEIARQAFGLAQHAHVKLALVAEMVVHRRDVDPGAAGDLPDGGAVEAVAAENLARRADDPIAGFVR